MLRHMLRTYPELTFIHMKHVLRRISDSPTHEFWPDNYDCLSMPGKGIQSHKHLTDAYLVNLAQANGGKVATLDRRMVDVYSPTALLVS